MKHAMIAMALILLGAFGTALVSTTPAAAADACDRKGRILTLKPWYHGLPKEDGCVIASPKDEAARKKFVNQVVMNIAEDLLHVAAYAAVAFVMYGGFIFMTSTGAPERAASGRKMVTNAIVGLVIAIGSIGIVNLLRGMLGI